MERKTKIIGTLGPASNDIGTIREMIAAGMNIARLNFSHGNWEEHGARIGLIRRAREETGRNIGLLQDLGGPKLRVGILPDEGVDLHSDTVVKLTAAGPFRMQNGIPVLPVDYPALLDDISAGSAILLDDGLLELKAERSTGNVLACRVLRGGRLTSRKGVSFPGKPLSLKAPTEKDLKDLQFGLDQGVDFVALSFVQSSEDIVRLRQAMESQGKNVPIVAKIERGVALDNIEGILSASDAVMVARGDLGIETDITMVPVYQKKIVQAAVRSGTAVIVATQMLESMTQNTLPTRAEASDVANAVYAGADAVMLSGESSIGKHPAGAVSIMARIATNVYNNLGVDGTLLRTDPLPELDSNEMAVARSVCLAADKIGARCIVAHTLSGKTARLIAQLRPHRPIVALSPHASTLYGLSITWGVECVLVADFASSFLDTLQKGDQALMKSGFAEKGDLVVVTAGIPEGEAGGTNVMKVHRVGQ